MVLIGQNYFLQPGNSKQAATGVALMGGCSVSGNITFRYGFGLCVKALCVRFSFIKILLSFSLDDIVKLGGISSLTSELN